MKGFEARRVPVDVELEAPDVALLDPVLRWAAARRYGEFALGDVDLVLDADEQGPERRGRRRQERLREAQGGPELVVRPERGDPSRVLQYAGATSEAGLSPVTGACV